MLFIVNASSALEFKVKPMWEQRSQLQSNIGSALRITLQ
jgi:hypothetical protein